MFFEVISNNEALFEVWVQIVLDLFCPSLKLPVTLLRISFVIEKTYGIRVPLAKAIDVFKLSALNKQLDLVYQGFGE